MQPPEHSSLNSPFSLNEIKEAIAIYGKTPFFLYHEKTIQDTCKRLQGAFQNNGFENFNNHFAVKANPNRHIIQIIGNTGMGTDCSSLSELHSSEALGIIGEKVMFTSNNTTREEFDEAKRIGAIINLDDISHIPTLEYIGLPEIVSCRWNPGDLLMGNSLIGNPKNIKYGMRTDQIIEAFRVLKEKGVKKFGLHTMVVTDEQRVESLVETSRLLFELAHQIHTQTGLFLDFINLGGGISVPYKPGQSDIDIEKFVQGVRRNYDDIIIKNKLGKPQIRMENGRYIMGNAGVYITRVTNISDKYHRFVGVDGGMQDFPRPGRVKAYHHITAIGKENKNHDIRQVITGSLCIGSDIFTPQLDPSEPHGRLLPELEIGDLLAIHTAGAHGHATGYNYNGRTRCGEILIRAKDNAAKIIRYPQTEENLHWGVPPIGNNS